MASENQNARLETFCDGVFAIAITLLILEIERPDAEQIGSARDLWQYLLHLQPSVYAFLLSFLIIGVQWATHHLFMKLVDRASDPFIYSNIFMLLPYVVMPFPTALLAEFWTTNARSTAVVLYSFTILLGNIGWLMLTYTALTPKSLATKRRCGEGDQEHPQTVGHGFWVLSVLYHSCLLVPARGVHRAVAQLCDLARSRRAVQGGSIVNQGAAIFTSRNGAPQHGRRAPSTFELLDAHDTRGAAHDL